MTKIALLQMTSSTNPGINATQLVEAVRQAAEGGAKMLFTPEMSGLLDRDRARASAAITVEDKDVVLSAVREAARLHNIWVVIGSLAIRTERTDGRFANRSFVIDQTGAIRARYDKMHMFDVDLASGETWRESNAFAPGSKSVIAPTPAGPLGLSICYDIRFPALYQRLSGAGAMLLNVPAAFTVPTGQAHWHCLLTARAIENACWVIASAQSGAHEDGRATFGHSLVVSPWGEIVLDMGDETGLAFIDIDLAAVDKARNHIPVLDHRRAVPDPEFAQ